MGYCVEIVIHLPPARARAWLSALPGWWSEPESADEMPYGEFQWGGMSLFADLGPRACQLSVPGIKYSWLICDHAPSMQHIAWLEGWLSESLPDVRTVRLSELVREKWEEQSGREWHQWPDSVQVLRDWLLSSGEDARYFRLLPDEQRHA